MRGVSRGWLLNSILCFAALNVVSGCGKNSSTANAPAVTLAQPMPAAAAASSALDRSVPLDRYEPIGDVRTVRLLALAFAPGTPTDETKLALVPEASAVNDAFARRDLATKALPAINKELDVAREQRYRRIEVSTTDPAPYIANPAATPSPPLRPTWWFAGANGGPLPLSGPYDFDQKGFPGPCLDDSALVTGVGQITLRAAVFHPANKSCVVPLGDESTAQRIESVRSKGGRFHVRATVYFFITASTGTDLIATARHMDLVLLDPADPSHAREFARLSVDF